MDRSYGALDAHIHYSLKYRPEELIRTMDDTCTAMANLVVVPSHTALSSVPDALMVKDMYPDRFFVFASLDVSTYFRYRGRVGVKMCDYARRMIRAGADGIKIIEGKPGMRKELPVPDWDSEEWDPFFEWAELAQIPILWHVNDPETFWDPERAPRFAVEMGWTYDDTFINNEAQYTQVLNLLTRHPNLHIIFAHFFFMSAQLPRLDAILTAFPNVMVDLTPGIEMYQHFSHGITGTRAFFEKYAGRIVYGTDIGARGVLGNGQVSYDESLIRADIVRTFLEGTEDVEITGDGLFLMADQGFTMHPLGLSGARLTAILSGNFLRFVGKEPAEVVPKLVLKEIKRIKQSLTVMGFIDKTLQKDTSCLDEAQDYFKRRIQK